MKRKIFSILFGLVFAFAAACSPGGGGSSDSGGKLVLSLTMNQGPDYKNIMRTLLPGIDMNPAEYIVTGAGPGGATFSETTTEETLIVESLAFGEWTIQADAHNLDDILIGRGSNTVTVHTGEDTYADVMVRPIEGFGTLNLTVNWPAGNVDNPSIDAQLIPYSGTAMTLGFTLGTGTATYSNINVPTGYYTLILKLLDNGVNVMGAVEVVRIVNEQVTTGTYDFPEVNTPGGGLIVIITPEMDDPLTISMTGQVAQLAQNESMTVTASVAEAVGNVTYVWYMNGNAVATGETYTATGLAIGVYRLDVTAFTIDGRRAGSATHSFRVVDASTFTPFAPSNLRIDYIDLPSIHISWDDNSTNETTFTVEMSVDGINFWQAEWFPENTVSWDVPQNEINYYNDNLYIRVFAATGSHVSGYSNVVRWGINDPFINLEYLTQFGTVNTDVGQGIVVDTDGNYYVSGFRNSPLAEQDCFITKYDPAGNVLWSNSIVALGGSFSGFYSQGIALDATGNIYFTTFTDSVVGQYYDILIKKFDTAGNELWSRTYGSTSYDYPKGIAVDSNNNIYITGRTQGSMDGTNYYGGYDYFIMKYDSNGNRLWVRQYGSSSDDLADSIVIDSDDNIYIPSYVWNSTGQLRKYDPSGNQLWSRVFGNNLCSAYISIDSSDNVLISGGKLFNINLLLEKYDKNGNNLISKVIPTTAININYGKAVSDSSNNIFLISAIDRGSFSPNVPVGDITGDDKIVSPGGGWADIYIMKFDPDGHRINTNYLGTSQYDETYSVAMDSRDNIFITGWTSGSLGSELIGNYDIFVMKLNTDLQ